VAYLTQYSGSIPVIKFPIDQVLMSIGQNIDSDICVPEDGIADNHAALESVKQNDIYRFKIKSQSGDLLIQHNGQAVSEAALNDGDWLSIGGIEFLFSDDGIDNIKETATPIDVMPVAEDKPHTEQLATESLVLELVQDTKEALTETAENMLNDSRFSRRLNFF